MRTLNPAAAALQARLNAGEQIPVVQLVHMLFTPTPLYLSTAGVPLQWAGQTWQGIGLSVSAIDDDVSEFGALQFGLPAVTPEQLALALSEDVQGTRVLVYDAWVDPATGTVAYAAQAWAGELDVPAIADGAASTITVNAEHRGAIALRPKPGRYTNDEQQRLHPGDLCLNFDPGTDALPVVWPAASFFSK